MPGILGFRAFFVLTEKAYYEQPHFPEMLIHKKKPGD
jgi:hypothetical protein